MTERTADETQCKSGATGPAIESHRLKPAPIAPVRPVEDNYHGTRVTDPYRYMEDLDDPEVQVWMKAQTNHTRVLLDSLPGHAALVAEVRKLVRSTRTERVDALQIVNGMYYTLRLEPGGQQPKLHVRRGADGEDRLLIDPEQLPGGQAGQLAITWYRPSPDNRYVAFAVSAAGSEEPLLQILDVAAGDLLPESMTPVWIEPPYWTADSRSFFYQLRQVVSPDMPATARYGNIRVCLHRVGRSFSDDPVVLGRGIDDDVITLAPHEVPSVVTCSSSTHAIAIISPGDERRVRAYAAPASAVATGAARWRAIAADYSDGFIGLSDWHGVSIALNGDTLYWLSYRDAPRGRIQALDLSRTDSAPYTVVEQGELPVSHVYAGSNALYWRVSDAGVNQAYRLLLSDGALPERLKLPYRASITTVISDMQDTVAVLGASSWLRSPGYLAVGVHGSDVTVSSLQPHGLLDQADDLTAEEVRVPSWDGTLVPLSVIRPDGLVRDGSHPALLIGYGAYGISAEPFFDPLLRSWLDRGMILAICHARGGGELGEAWHRAGFQDTKPNTWKDFIACAEYLIAHGYTTPERLAGSGTSAGGILIGRAIQERPDLFAAAQALVPATDMLRFETTANGPPNIREFGSVETEAGFRALHAMSPYANVADGTRYPALFVTAGINDPRVEPWMAAKFVARMQAATASGKPVLLHVDYDGGHGVGSSLDSRIARFTDSVAFVLWQTGHPDFQLPAPAAL